MQQRTIDKMKRLIKEKNKLDWKLAKLEEELRPLLDKYKVYENKKKAAFEKHLASIKPIWPL